jgi:hypothetical protein
LWGSQYQPRRGTADDGSLVVPGVHALQSWSIYTYSRVLGYGHSCDLHFPWLVSGVLSSLSLGFGAGFRLWSMRQGTRGSRPHRLESVTVVRCVWWNGRTCRWDGLKLDELLLKLDILTYETTTTNRSFALPLHFTTTKQTQSIGWEPAASTNRTDNCLVGSEPEYDY